MDDLEKRLINTERALAAMWSLLKNQMAPQHSYAIDVLMEEYFNANKALGSNFDLSNGFICEEKKENV